MTDKPNIRIFTLKGLAEAEDVSEDYLRKILMDIRKNKESEWRGYKFIALGAKKSKRNTWVSYKGDELNLEIYDGAEQPASLEDSPEAEAAHNEPA